MPVHESKTELVNGSGAAAIGGGMTVGGLLNGSNIGIFTGIGLPFLARTANYTATLLDFLIHVDATTGAITITLPALASVKLGNRGLLLCIKKMDASANAVIIDGNGAETIDGAATVSLLTRYETRMIIASTSEWSVI